VFEVCLWKLIELKSSETMTLMKAKAAAPLSKGKLILQALL
jgi:hypothetical protein